MIKMLLFTAVETQNDDYKLVYYFKTSNHTQRIRRRKANQKIILLKIISMSVSKYFTVGLSLSHFSSPILVIKEGRLGS